LSVLVNSTMGEPDYRRRHGLVTVRSEISNRYGTRTAFSEEVPEYQDLVIATQTMPPEDWVRTRSFAWMAMLLHFDKLLQIPFVLLNTVEGLGYRTLIETFMVRSSATYPIVAGIETFFNEKARDIQRGNPEYCHTPQWLDMWWMADEFMVIKLCYEKQLDGFYCEAGCLLRKLLAEQGVQALWLDDALALNRNMLKLPFQNDVLDLTTSFNIWEHYQSVLKGHPVPLKSQKRRYRVDRTTPQWKSWDDWLRDVIWLGNKTRSYIYDCAVL
ncbi:MAG: hypothetical protein ABIJ53_01095, partial [Verrucomicrobiota bacterium]